MAKKFVLVSLQEKKAKKLAEVLSNNTCRRILDYMASHKDVTESELSKELKIPISTVHYNMKALMTAKLVKSDEYHYSPKGKEVSHYKLANQYVIIAPEGEKKALKEQLKSLLPITLVAGASASLIRLFTGSLFSSKVLAGASKADTLGIAQDSSQIAEAPAREAVAYTAERAADASVQSAEVVNESARAAVNKAVESPPLPPEPVVRDPGLFGYASSHIPEIIFWFIVGALLGAGIFFLVRYVRSKRRKQIRIQVNPKKK